ncbi:MAG: hypothetical protein GX952_05430 [Firmicutes bacterium]|nr:hypothetical protein [Bacillota bacterium]
MILRRPYIRLIRTLPGPAGNAIRAQLNFNTIQAAIDAAVSGSTVLVPPGIYNEQIVIDKALTLTGPDPGLGEAIIDAAGLPAVPTVWIQADDVTVRRLTVRNGAGQAIVVGSDDHLGLDRVLIEHNIITGHGRAGILTLFSAAIVIRNNIISGNATATGFGRAGIYLNPHGPCQVSNNTILANAQVGLFASESGSGLVVENNTIEQHTNSGITLAWDERNVIISGNRIRFCGLGDLDEQGGIVILQSSAELIEDNIIEECNRYGIMWGWVPTVEPVPSEILFTGNTIRTCQLDGIFLFSQGPGGFISPDLFPLEPIITGNVLLDNGRAGVYVSNVYYYSPGNANPNLFCNSFSGNEWGVFNGTAGVIDAVDNWWGSSSGPFNPQLNPEGRGDQVSDRVNFIPWKSQAPITGVDWIEVERVLGWCTGKAVSAIGIDMPPETGEDCAGVDLALVDQAQCKVDDYSLSVVQASYDVSSQNLKVILSLWAEVEICLLDQGGKVVYCFNEELKFLAATSLPICNWNEDCPDWLPHVSGTITAAGCQLEPIGVEPSALVGSVFLCFSLQATHWSRLCVPTVSGNRQSGRKGHLFRSNFIP